MPAPPVSRPEVPAELRGREVSHRMFAPLFEAAKRSGHSREALAKGAGYPLAHLENRRERSSWAAAVAIFENLGRILDDAELVALGASLIGRPIHRAMLVPGRLLFSLEDIFAWGSRPDGPLVQLAAPQRMRVEPRGPRQLRLETVMAEGYPCPREFWLLRQGFLSSVSRAFGLPASKVTMTTATSEGAVFDLVLPEESGLLRRVREKTTWVRAAREVAAELRTATDDLHVRYAELQREVEARKAAEQKLRELNEALEERVKARTSELEMANQALAEANSDLTMFNAAVAHDLRSPLRTVHGFASMVLEDHGAEIPREAHQQLARVLSGAERMSTLIDALLSLARVGRADVRPEVVDLGELAHRTVADLRAADPERDVHLTIEPDLRATGDRALLQALVDNLLGNAWKFTRDQPEARIALSRDDDDAFCVRDNGAGFDMRRVERLFAPFQRLHSASEFEGTGIGLSICERVVRRHGGRIWAEGEAGAGAAFHFTLRTSS